MRPGPMMIVSRHEPVECIDEQLTGVICLFPPFRSLHASDMTVVSSGALSVLVTMVVRLTGVNRIQFLFGPVKVSDMVAVSTTVSVLVTMVMIVLVAMCTRNMGVATDDGDGMVLGRVPTAVERVQGRRMHDDRLLEAIHTLARHEYWPSKRVTTTGSFITPL